MPAILQTEKVTFLPFFGSEDLKKKEEEIDYYAYSAQMEKSEMVLVSLGRPFLSAQNSIPTLGMLLRKGASASS